MLERKGSVLRRCITEVTVLAQVQLSGCLLCLLGRNQGCCGCRAGQVVEYVVRVGRFEGFENECRLAAAFGDGFASGIAVRSRGDRFYVRIFRASCECEQECAQYV